MNFKHSIPDIKYANAIVFAETIAFSIGLALKVFIEKLSKLKLKVTQDQHKIITIILTMIGPS